MSEELAKQPSEIQVIANNINSGLAAFETRKTELTQLKKDAEGLTIESIDDKQAISQVSTWRKKLKAARVEIQKEGKAMRDPLTKISKSISEKEYELIDIIGPTEKELQSKEDWVKVEEEKIRLEGERKEQERIQKRIDRLREYGFEIDLTFIKSISDEDFEGVVNTAKIEFEKEKAIQAEKERQDQESREQAERDRLELQALRQKQEETDRILKERQDELNRQERELKAQQDAAEERERKRVQDEHEAKIKSRINQMGALGLVFDFSDRHYKGFGCFVPIIDIQTHTEEDWAKLIADVTPVIERSKDKQAQEAEEKRLKELEEAKQKVIVEEQDRQREVAVKAAEDKRLAEVKRQEELEKAGDKAIWADFIARLAQIEVPTLRSGQYRKIGSMAREKIEEIQKLKP